MRSTQSPAPVCNPGFAMFIIMMDIYKCMLYMDCWPLKYDYYNRRAKFLNKLKMNENSVVTTWFNEFEVICDKFGVPIDRPWGMQKHILNNFVSNISVH